MNNKTKGIVYGKGINDMPSGWRLMSKWNEKVYNLWRSRLNSVYSEKFHNKHPTYIDVTLCLEWHWLSKFAKDVVEIDGYDEYKFLKGELELDKDIKSNGENREYSLENCKFVTKRENVQFAVTGDKHYLYGKKLPSETRRKISENSTTRKNVVGINIKDNSKLEYKSSNMAKNDGFIPTHIIQCCLYNSLGEEEYSKAHSTIRRTHRGYKWYYKEDYEKRYMND